MTVPAIRSDARVVILLASMLIACAWHGQRIKANLQGESLGYDQVAGSYCEHCSGTQKVFVSAQGDGRTPLHMGFAFASCKYGLNILISPDGGAELSYGQDERAVAGEIHCHSGREDWVDFSFWGVFPDGKRIEGRLSTALKHDAGYD
jgi:hypothetical protein